MAMATTALPAMMVLRMLPNSVGPSSLSSLYESLARSTEPGPFFGVLLYLLYPPGLWLCDLGMAAGEDADAREGECARKCTAAKEGHSGKTSGKSLVRLLWRASGVACSRNLPARRLADTRLARADRDMLAAAPPLAAPPPRPSIVGSAEAREARRARPRRRGARLVRASSSSSSSSSSATTTQEVYLDVSFGGADDAPPRRFVFALRPDLAPRTCAGFVALLTGSNAGVDPSLTYRGCAFEPFGGKYAHVVRGLGATIHGSKKFVERDAMSRTRRSTPGAGGGVYYGEEVDLDLDPDATVVCVPVAGPGYGGSRFAIVRVGDSPASLRQRILTNQMVLGRVTRGRDILFDMIQAERPVEIVGGGVL